MFQRALAPLCAILLFAAPALAQDDEAMMQAWMAYMTPGEPHTMLTSQAGEWSHQVSMWMAPGAPAMESTATSTAEPILGGRYLVERFSGNMMGMPFEGQALIGYDNAKKKFFSTWVDNMGTGMMTAWGEVDPTTHIVTFTGTVVDPMTGEDKPFREVHTHSGPNEKTMEMYGPGPDGQEYKMMEIHSTRAAGE
jgi:hypothetical protein